MSYNGGRCDGTSDYGDAQTTAATAVGEATAAATAVAAAAFDKGARRRMTSYCVNETSSDKTKQHLRHVQ